MLINCHKDIGLDSPSPTKVPILIKITSVAML